MPRHPDVAQAVKDTRGSIYSMLGQRMATFEGEVFPLHVGDTWMEPAEGCRMEDLRVADHPGMHRYTSVKGLPALLSAIARKHPDTSPDSVLVTAGATGALGAAVGALVDPGGEVLIPAPFWPLIAGIVRTFRGVPVVVPGMNTATTVDDMIDALDAAVTTRTAALYLNTPNNPTGRVLPPDWVEALVGWATSRDLWILSDEVYEDYAYLGTHQPARPLAPERTFAAHSFSKAYGMAGNRCGYLLGPESVMAAARKVSTHAFYSTPTAAQIAAARVLDGPGAPWIKAASEQYEKTGRAVAEMLGVDPPEGGTFLFFDIKEALDGRGLAGFLMDCADRGLFVAPGDSFGPYPTHIRVCFTAAKPEAVMRGVGVLATLLGR